MKIRLSEDAKPFAITAARKIPFAWQEQVKKELDELESKGIIKEVEKPTTWCRPMVVVPKKDSNDPRVCVDLTKLKQHVRRGPHPVSTSHDVITGIGKNSRYFTKLDAKSGYFQIAIAEDRH